MKITREEFLKIKCEGGWMGFNNYNLPAFHYETTYRKEGVLYCLRLSTSPDDEGELVSIFEKIL